jgi:hypothetical protein
MLIWLASYPRSGNTLLRIILSHVFGLETYSLYNDTVGVGADKATTEIVGHAFLLPEWSPDQARLDEELWLVKTHQIPQDGDKAIYIIRDGREVSVSYLNYLRTYRQQEVALFSIIIGAVNFGSWSDHVLAWTPLERENTLLLRFEELAANPEAYVPTIADFIGREPTSKSIPTFSDLHKVNPTFFRSGKTDSWKNIFDQDDHILFWLLHQDVMIKYGYDNEVPDVFQRGLSPSEQHIAAVAKKAFEILVKQKGSSLQRQSELRSQQSEKLAQKDKQLKRQNEQLKRQNEQLKQQSERLKRLGEQLSQQSERMEQLATENRTLNLELGQLQNSWSWKMTKPLRKMGRTLMSLKK